MASNKSARRKASRAAKFKRRRQRATPVYKHLMRLKQKKRLKHRR